MFTQGFGKFVCEGDAIECEVDGFTCKAFTARDESGDTPDERMDGFWPSLDPNDAGYIGPKSKSTLRRHKRKAQQIMDAWKNDEWDYCGVCVVVYRNDIKLTDIYTHALWGVERNYPGSDNDYLRQVANDLLPEALEDARAKIAALCK